MLAASIFLSAEYEKQLWLMLGFAAALTTLAGVSGRPHYRLASAPGDPSSDPQRATGTS
jgi:hypothetical protein